VRVYPMKIWNEIEEKLARLSSHNRTKQKFLTRTNYYGQVVELDGQGRILVPSILRESAQMRGDVDVLGNLSYLQIWNHTRVLDNLKASPITDDDEKTLDELGI
jgi:MraZ protein